MEVPRKSILSSEEVISLVEKLTKDLSSHAFDTSTQDAIKDLSLNLKHHGPSLESSHRAVLDNLQKVLRFACRDNNLDLVSRVYLLEIIELRALKWVPSDHVTNYYKSKLAQINGEFLGEPPILALEEPAASLQSKTTGSMDSGLNVNAPEFTVSQSKGLREDVSSQMLPRPPTISLELPPMGRKKASHGTEDSSANKTGIHTATFKTVDGEVTISSSNGDLFHRAEAVLKEKLAHQLLQENNEDKSSKPELTYGRKELLELATSPLCSVPPFNWEKISSQVPDMVKSPAALGDTKEAVADQPDHEKAVAGQPDHVKAVAGQPDHVKAVAGQPDHVKAVADQPDHEAGQPDHEADQPDQAKRLRLQ